MVVHRLMKHQLDQVAMQIDFVAYVTSDFRRIRTLRLDKPCISLRCLRDECTLKGLQPSASRSAHWRMKHKLDQAAMQIDFVAYVTSGS